MRRSLIFLCTLLPTTLAGPLAAAADDGNGLATLMDETALAVARIDISAKEPAATFASLAFGGQLRPTQSSLWPNMFQKLLTAAGVRHVVLIFQVPNQLPTSYQQFSVEALCVVPCDKAETAETIGKLPGLLPPDKSWRVATRGRYCLVGPTGLVTSALAGNHPTRPNLETALAAAGDSPLSLVVAPSADQHRVLSALFPELPAEYGGSLLRAWAGQAEWTTMAYDPDRTFRLVIRATSPQNAISLVDSFDAFLKGPAAKVRAINGRPVQTGPLLAAIEKRVDNDNVILSVDLAKLPPGDNIFRRAADSALLIVNRHQAMQHLKQVGIAMHNYHESNKRFPDAASRAASGKPLLSWRVHILPFLDQTQTALYNEFHLNEPWDSDHNRKLIARMPDVYRIAGGLAPGKTCLELPIGAATAWPEGRGIKIRENIDGTSNTILAVETDDEHAVFWTQPSDLAYDAAHPAAGLGSHFGEGFLTLSADGAAHFLALDTNPDTLRALFSAAGREPVGWPGQ
ncbi:MAG TPA: DUF1559 domain-containing protein [Pirellulales bacterium]|jgi:hypothetical protein|nr:DUF1559 domain-containing protein [Pirellulales bacterium]